jgi:hypothetical protein
MLCPRLHESEVHPLRRERAKRFTRDHGEKRMKRTEGHRPWTMVLVSLAMILPAGLVAQDAAELDLMHHAAMAEATGGTADFEKATWMHGIVANLRAADDPRRFQCLRDHANLLYNLGFVEGAQAYLEEAGEQAASTGDNLAATMTFIDAALLARESGDTQVTRDLAMRAAALSTYPGLDRAERAAIMARLGT